jgi:hypothetical protein
MPLQTNLQRTAITRGTRTSMFEPAASSYTLARDSVPVPASEVIQPTNPAGQGVAGSLDRNGDGGTSTGGDLGFGPVSDAAAAIGRNALSGGLTMGGLAALGLAGLGAPLGTALLGGAIQGIQTMAKSGLTTAASGIYEAITSETPSGYNPNLGSGYLGSGWGSPLGGGFTPGDPFMDSFGVVGREDALSRTVNTGPYQGMTVSDALAQHAAESAAEQAATGPAATSQGKEPGAAHQGGWGDPTDSGGGFGGYSGDAMSAAASQADAQAAENASQGYGWGGDTGWGGGSGGSSGGGIGGTGGGDHGGVGRGGGTIGGL